jgi:hypothetical protein
MTVSCKRPRKALVSKNPQKGNVGPIREQQIRESRQTSPRGITPPPRACIISTITRTRRASPTPTDRIPRRSSSAPTPRTVVVRVRIGPPTSLATIAVACAALPPASRVPSSTVGHTALPAASRRLLLALLATLDDVLDAHATPREAGRGVPVLQVAWVRLRVGVACSSLVLGVADGLFACDFGLLACWNKSGGLVCVGIVFIGDWGEKWRGHGEMAPSQVCTLLTLPNVSVWQGTTA